MTYINETFDNVYSLDIEKIETNLNKYFDEHIINNDFIGIIGEFNGNVVSVAYLIIYDFPANPNIVNGKRGTLFNVYTFPEYRKKGIAERIIKEIIKEAKLRDIDSIDLKATDDGYNLYKKLGFIDDNNYKGMILKM